MDETRYPLDDFLVEPLMSLYINFVTLVGQKWTMHRFRILCRSQVVLYPIFLLGNAWTNVNGVGHFVYEAFLTFLQKEIPNPWITLCILATSTSLFSI